MTSHDLRPDDHETLSALFDGELDGEARRFAARRLDHDMDWQATCGRWQAIGDAMRRQAPIAAPVGFAGGVSAALATERAAAPLVAAGAPGAPVRTRRMRWIGGGALAASLALAAVISLRTTETPMQPPARIVADASAPAPALAQAPGSASAPTAIASVEAPVPAAPVAAASAVDTLERSRVPQTLARRGPARAVAVASRIDVAPAVAEAALQAGQSGNPFNLSGDEALTARPWPRAALVGGATSFTARYGAAGDSAGERPSFYPFEPRPQGEPEPVPTP